MGIVILDFDDDRIIVTTDDTGGVIINSNLKRGCTEPSGTCIGCAAIDGIESLILGHALAGIDITSAAYKEGIRTALDTIGN